MQEGELTLKLLNLFLDALTKFPALEGVLVPFFHELVSKTLARLRNATAKEGFLDLLLSLFRAISVQPHHNVLPSKVLHAEPPR